MNESGNKFSSPEAVPLTDREQHETALNAVIERLRNEGYFRDGESAEIVFPEPGKTEKWLARCDLKAYTNAPVDSERKKKFPSSDTFHDALVASGFKVDVWPDFDRSDNEFFYVEYHLSR